MKAVRTITFCAIAVAVILCGGCGSEDSDRGILNAARETRKGEFTDPRDGQNYRTVKIGDYTWMAENLKYGGDTLYYSSTAATACPSGWQLPNSEAWDNLAKAIDRDPSEYSGASNARQLASKKWCFKGRCGYDRYGWAAMPTDIPNYGYEPHALALFWGLQSGSSYSFISIDMDTDRIRVNVDGWITSRFPAAIRCVKD